MTLGLREYDISKARRSEETLTSPENRGDSLYAKCILNFAGLSESQKNKLRTLDDWVFETGARVGPSLSFWSAFRPFGSKVIDLGASLPMEMKCAGAKGWYTHVFHPDSKWYGYDIGYTGSKGLKGVSTTDVVFVDWDWGDHYKDGKLTVPSDEWHSSHLAQLKSYEASFLVTKSVRNMEMYNVPYTIHVSKPNHKTAYMITVPGKLFTLIKLFDHFVNQGYECRLLDETTESCVKVARERSYKCELKTEEFEKLVKKTFREARNLQKSLKVEEVESILSGVLRENFDWEQADEMMNAISTSSILDVIKLLEGSMSTLSNFVVDLDGEWFDSCKLALKRLLQACYSLKSSLYPELHSAFKEDAVKLAGTLYPQTHEVCFGADKGHGFFSGGVLTIPYHVSKARPIQIGTYYYKAHTVDEMFDLVSYGGPLPSFSQPRRDEDIVVKGPVADLVGKVVRLKPLQVLFPGAPIPGLSGSPMLTKDGRLVGVYSNHILGPGNHLTIPTKDTWAKNVAHILDEQDRINVYVPCSNGKTTLLPKVVAKHVGTKVMVVVPRTNLADATAKFMGPKVRGFAGEDAIEDSDADIVLVTHGKFLSYVLKGTAFLSEYKVLMIDEAHDQTALTKACLNWAEKNWSGKLVFMTGSPNDSDFGTAAIDQQKFPVKRTILKHTAPLSESMILKLLNEDKDHTYLVQVATKKVANSLIPKVPKSCLISRDTVIKHSIHYFIDGLNKGEIRVAFITNVVNFGQTLPVDKIILSGDVVEVETNFNSEVLPIKRVLSYSEVLQYVGRVGRVRDGEAIMPNLKWTRPALSQQEDLLLRAWEYLLDPDAGDVFQAHGFEATREQVTTAMKLDGALSHNLGLVDVNGLVYAKDVKSQEYCEEKGIPWTDDKVITCNYNGKVGPYTGFDPVAPLQTGIMSVGAIVSSIYCLLKPTYGVLGKPIDMFGVQDSRRFKKSFKINDLRFKALEPGIKVTALNKEVDDSVDVYFNTITTSLVSSLSWLARFVSFLCPVRCNGCEVTHSLLDSGKAEAVSYWLAGHGITGTYHLTTGDEPLFSTFSTNTQLTKEEELLLHHRFDLPVLIATSKSWHLIPSVLGLILGPLALLIPAFFSVFRYHENTIRKWPRLSAFVRSFDTNLTADDYNQSGVAAVMSVATSLSGLQPALFVSWLSGLIWNFKIGPLVIPLSLKNKWTEVFVASGTAKYLIGIFAREHLARWASVLRIGTYSTTSAGFVFKLLEAANIYKPSTVLGVSMNDVVTFVLTYLVVSLGWFYRPIKFWTLLYPLFFFLLELWFIRFNPLWAFIPALGLVAFFSRLQVEDLRAMYNKGRFYPNTSRDEVIRVSSGKVFKKVHRARWHDLETSGDLDDEKIKRAVSIAPRWGTIDPFGHQWFASTDLTLNPDIYIEREQDWGSVFLPISTSQNISRLTKIRKRAVKATVSTSEVVEGTNFSIFQLWFGKIVAIAWNYLFPCSEEALSPSIKLSEFEKSRFGLIFYAVKNVMMKVVNFVTCVYTFLREKLSRDNSSASSINDTHDYESALSNDSSEGSEYMDTVDTVFRRNQVSLFKRKWFLLVGMFSRLLRRRKQTTSTWLILKLLTFSKFLMLALIGFVILAVTVHNFHTFRFDETDAHYDDPLSTNLSLVWSGYHGLINLWEISLKRRVVILDRMLASYNNFTTVASSIVRSVTVKFSNLTTSSYLESLLVFVIGATSFSQALNVGVFPAETFSIVLLSCVAPIQFALLVLSLLSLSRGIIDLGILGSLLSILIPYNYVNVIREELLVGTLVSALGFNASLIWLVIHAILWVVQSICKNESEVIATSASFLKHLRKLNRRPVLPVSISTVSLLYRFIFRTQWVRHILMSIFLLLTSYAIHPILFAFVMVQVVSTVSSLLIWLKRFSYGTLPEFDKSMAKLLSHTNLGDSDLPSMTGEGPPVHVPRFQNSVVLVVGAAGSPRWLEKAIGLYYNYTKVMGDIGFLIISDQHLQLQAEAFAKDKPNVKVLVMELESPAQMRMARLAPLFWGDSSTYYLHRDADWMVTPLELAASRLHDNVVVNPIGVSVSANMLASVNYFGSFGSHLRSKWWGSHSVWHHYGTDEQLCDLIPFNHVYNRLTPNEQTLFAMCARRVSFGEARKLYVPTEYLHNSNILKVDVDFRVADIQSFGDSRWSKTLHNLCSGTSTFCSSRTKHDIVSTGYFNWYFLAAASVQLVLRDTIERFFLTCGIETATLNRVQSSLKQLAFSLGSLMGVASGAKGTLGAYHKGVYLSAVRTENGRNLNEYNNYDKKFKLGDLFHPDSSSDANESSIKWFSLLASPVAFLIAQLSTHFVPIGDESSLCVALAAISMGHPLSIFSGLIRMTATCIKASKAHVWSDSILLPLTVATSRVSWFSWDPKPGVVATLDVPHLGKSDSEVMKQIYPRNRTRGWISGWDRGSYVHALPSGMLNLRTSTIIALVRHELVSRQVVSTVVFGSGIGGIAQGLLHENVVQDLTLYTLDDPGFNTDPMVINYAKEKGIELDVIVGDFRTMCYKKFDRVFLDVAKPVDDSIWYSDDFAHRDDQEVYEANCLTEALCRVEDGGTLIVSTMCDMAMVPHEYLGFLSVYFSRITVVEDPLKRTAGFLWIIAERKLHRKDPFLRSLTLGKFDWYDWRFPTEWFEFFNEGMSRRFNNQKDISSYWYPKLHSLFKPPLCTTSKIVWSLDSKKYLDVGLSLESLEFIESSSIIWVDSFSHSWTSRELIPSRLVMQCGTVRQLGRTVTLPVPDREFNAGVDLFSISVLATADLLPLERQVDIPSQSNFALLDGLRKRYDFPIVSFNARRFWDVFEQWADYLGARARGYDFGLVSWDDLKDHAYRKSTMGYMSISPFKSVGEALDDEKYMDDYFDKFVGGGIANLGFHGSPKVEKKEPDSPGQYLVPRIFMYKTGEVRLCEMRITKKLNDFLLDDQCNPHASNGDIFYRAAKIVEMFESFKNPAAFEGESSKFDGHLEAELLVQLRRFFCKLVSYGRNSSLLQNYIQSMTVHDVLPNVYLASGDVVSFHRGAMTSGLWCTSCGDSAINEIPSFIAKMSALNIPFEECFNRFKTSTCGDDKIEVGEIGDVEKVLNVRNSTYEEFGIIQTSENKLIERPENSSYCSHGYTRVTEDVCVPVRDLHELFARLIVPCANGQFRLDFPMASRSLSSVISLVATYWYVPEVVRFYEIIKGMIPKSVIPAAIARTQRWKFEYNLGGLDPISFSLPEFLQRRFGRDPRSEVILNSFAVERLNLPAFRSLMSVSLAAASKTLMDLSSKICLTDLSVWYDDGLSIPEVVTDLIYLGKNKTIECFFEKSVAARDYLRTRPLPNVTVHFGTLRSVLGRAKTKELWLMFSPKGISYRNWLLLQPAAYFRNAGFRGDRIKLATIDRDSFLMHKVINTSKSSVTMLKILLGATFIMPALYVVSTSTLVGKGNLISYNYGAVLTSIGEVKRMIFPLSEPRVEEGEGVGKWLALENMNSRTQYYSLGRNHALKTVDTLCKLTRRFGMFVYDSTGQCHSYVAFIDGYEPKVGDQEWVDMETLKDLNKRLGDGAIISPKKWRTNGAMITITEWQGNYHYGQIERPAPFFHSLSHRIFSVVFFVRISDCGILCRDGKHGNVYCFPNFRLPSVPIMAPIIGESSGPMLIDIPKPYDADILGGHPMSVVDWEDKALKAIFYGGSTGSGTKPKNNVRVWLVENEGLISSLSGVPCEFRFTSMTNRIVRSLDGTLGLLKDGDYPLYHPKSMEEQSAFKIIVIPEGHEAPDRVLGVMMTGSLALIMRPTHVVTTESWFNPLLKDKVNCLMCNPEIKDIVANLTWVKENNHEAERIAKSGVSLSATLTRVSVMRDYMCSVLAMADRSSHSRTEASDFLNWKIQSRAGHRLIMVDTEHQYVHGTAFRVDSSAFHIQMMEVDVGCGCTLSKPIAFKPELEYLARKIKKGEEIYPSGDHLTTEEFLLASSIAMTAGIEVSFIVQRLGTLGSGNHFLEMVWNKGQTYWLVHTGSRGVSQRMVRSAIEKNCDGLEVARMVDARAQEVANLNRKVVLRLLGAEVAQTWVHCKLTHMNEGIWFVKNLISDEGKFPLLSSPGTGFAMVENSHLLCPHGMGRKGGRARPLKGAHLDVLYQTVLRTKSFNVQHSIQGFLWFAVVEFFRMQKV